MANERVATYFADVGKTVDNFTSLDIHTPDVGKEGDNLPTGTRNDESEQKPQLGTDESTDGQELDLDDDHFLSIDEVRERFVRDTVLRLKAKTQKRYLQTFQRLVKFANLEEFSKKDLTGRKGRELMLAFLGEVRKTAPKSLRYVIAGLVKIYSYGLRIPFPIDVKRDLGRQPKVARRTGADSRVIDAWNNALALEKDLWTKLMWNGLCIGWRPSQLCALKWKNVRRDHTGRPRAIMADGTTEGFKTPSPIKVRLHPDFAELLVNVERNHSNLRPEWPLLPWKSTVDSREIDWGRPANTEMVERHMTRLMRKYSLTRLLPVEIRHWVSAACREAGLSRVATAYLQGHDATQGGAMRDFYDNPTEEEILDEQARCIPRGPLGTLKRVEIEVGLPQDVDNLWSAYCDGRIDTIEFAKQAEALRSRIATEETARSRLL